MEDGQTELKGKVYIKITFLSSSEGALKFLCVLTKLCFVVSSAEKKYDNKIKDAA